MVFGELAARLIELLRSDDTAAAAAGDGRDRIAAALAAPGIELGEALARARAAWGLSSFEADVLAAVIAPEVDARFARGFALLHPGVERGRPTAGTLLDLLRVEPAQRPRAFEALLGDRPLRRYGLIELDGAGPLATRPIRPAADVVAHLLGAAPPDPRLRPARVDAIDRLVLPAGLAERIAAIVTAGRAAPSIVIVHGEPGTGRDAIAVAIAHAGGRAALVVGRDESAALGGAGLERSAAWFGAAIVVADGPAAIPPHHAALRAPQIWVTSRSGFDDLPVGDREVHLVEAPALDAERRAAIWDRLLPVAGRADLDLDALARRYRLGPGAIRRAIGAATAAARAADPGDPRLDQPALVATCRALPATELEQVAQRLPCPYRLEDLVIGKATRRELDFALGWVRHHRAIFTERGMASRMPLGLGLTCLFAGPPGTGKTMAAQVIARELELDLYRVDLSRVVSKYIGETEKNLDRVFAQARAANAMIVFDEADALFAKRTDVRDAHDRHANVETGYLLQRIEVHDGVTVLTTNLRKNIDDAFQRRMQVVAEFAMPGVGERARIWERNLPARPHLADDVELGFLAERFELSGGLIRNAAVAATVLAATEGTRVDMVAVLCATLREQRRAGRLVEPFQLARWAPEVLERIGREPGERA